MRQDMRVIHNVYEIGIDQLSVRIRAEVSKKQKMLEQSAWISKFFGRKKRTSEHDMPVERGYLLKMSEAVRQLTEKHLDDAMVIYETIQNCL
jgi:hypothetical protein